MIDKEAWMLIRGLAQKVKQGLSVSEIARQTGHDRKTIRKYLSTEQKPQYQKAGQVSKLEPYKNYIELRLKEVPEVSNRRILREIKEQGYTGSRSILGDFTKPLRAARHQAAVIRFETMPGEQAQVDWSSFGTIEYAGLKQRLYCFSMVLGFSRTIYIEWTVSQDIFTWLRCHQNAFRYFGGYTRTLLYDNLKTVVLSRCGSNIQWNLKFMDFAGFYGFEPKLCRVYRAQTKGKVERPFQYIWQDFFLGAKFNDIEDLNRQSRLWLDNVANIRMHGTTKEIPLARLKQENLLPLAGRLYDTAYAGIRKASADGFISYQGNRYSVPYQYSRKHLSLKADQASIRLYVTGQAEPVARHPLFKGKGKDISEPAHLAGLKVRQKERWAGFKESFLSLAAIAQDYWAGFVASAQMRGRWWELRKILSLCQKNNQADVQYALTRALKYQAFGYKYIANILEQCRQGKSAGPKAIDEILKEVLVRWPIAPVEKRDLKSYEQFINQ
jgi:transposase